MRYHRWSRGPSPFWLFNCVWGPSFFVYCVWSVEIWGFSQSATPDLETLVSSSHTFLFLSLVITYPSAAHLSLCLALVPGVALGTFSMVVKKEEIADVARLHRVFCVVRPWHHECTSRNLGLVAPAHHALFFCCRCAFASSGPLPFLFTRAVHTFSCVCVVS